MLMNIFTKFHAYICMCFFVTFRSALHMNLAAILKFPLAILKMEKFAMANEKIFTRKVWRTYSESLMLVSGSAWSSQKTDISRSTSGAGIDNNHAHPEASMKLGRNVH